MELDLRFNKKISPDYAELFDDISFSLRERFNDFIDNLSRPLIDDIDWWAQNPASRNTYTSPLFHYFCSVSFFIEILKIQRHETSDILVDSKELKIIFDNLLKRNNRSDINIIYRPGRSLERKRLFKKLFYFQYFTLKRYIQYLLIRLFDDFSKDSLQANPITIIDTFLSLDFINEDRWYGSFWENVEERLKSRIFFVPTIIDTPLKEMKTICSNSRNDGRNIIFKDHFLAMDDFIFSYRHKFRIKRKKIKEILVNNIDYSGLVREDIEHNRDIQTLVESLLTYRFISKLKKQGVNLRLAIDWFEGHSLDKLWNLSLKHHFPDVKRIGYETYRSFPYYLSTFPIQIERDAGTIPDVFAVQGSNCIDCVREFLPNQDVIVIPAFKYSHVWNHDIQLKKHDKKVLVTLPISLDVSERILKLLIDACKQDKRINQSDIEFIIKRHPKNTTSQILDYCKLEIPSKFSFTEEKSFPALLEKSTVLVTEASSTCLEAMAYGISVIIIENSSGLTYDPIPKEANKKLFRRSRTKDSLSKSLFDFLNYDEREKKLQRQLGLDFKNNFFEPVSQNGIYRFLDIGESEK